MGCTIGAVRRHDNTLILFKNRDLIKERQNPIPLIKQGKNHRYVAFGVDSENKLPGLWAGVNDKGLAIAGADGNSLRDFVGEQYGGGERTWEAYEEVLSLSKSVVEAYPLLLDFYSKHKIGGSGDIILIADTSRVAILEYSLNVWGIEFLESDPHIIRTNFFNILKHLRPAPEESSVHMSSSVRFERAVDLLSKSTDNTTVEDIKALCRDHGRDASAFSICRHGGPGEYRTMCSVIIEISSDEITVYHVVNGFPCETDYSILTLDIDKS